MKKTILLILSSIICYYSFSQNIPNRGFENWYVDTLYENTSEWLTPLDEFYSPVILTVEKSIDAHEGMFSILLSNDTIWNEDDSKLDSTFGYALQGSLGEDGPNGGISYTSDIDSITGWYKCDMAGTDTAVVLIVQYSSTDTIMQAFGIGGAQSTWTRFSFALDSITTTLEEVFVGVISSDPNIGGFTGEFNPESWIMIDNMSFVSNSGTVPAAIPDFSFEDWYEESYEDPADWFTFNLYSTIIGDNIQVEKTTDAKSGNYAMKITSEYSEALQDTIGVILNTEIGDNLPGGFAFDEVPLNISGYYKYNPATNWDTAMVAVFLSKWNTVGDSTDEIDVQFFQLLPQATYTSFSFDLDTAGIDTSMFDSVNIVFVSSQYGFDGGAPLGSELFLDDVWLDSKCAFADTTELWYFDSTYVSAPAPDVPYFEAPSGYISYSWSNGTNDSLLSLPLNEVGTYILTVVDSNGCIVVDKLIIESETLSNINSKIESLISIYPNPTSSTLNIDLSKAEQSLEKEITISDLLGNQILSTFVRAEREKINISEYPTGVYLLKIRIGEELTTLRVVKK